VKKADAKEEASKASDQADNRDEGANPLAEQAAKLAPNLSSSLSAQLLQKAAELRADKLTPQDIERFKQAAQALAKDLPKLANSPEFQRAAEQLARQVSPEQIEAVARQIMANEKIRDEIRAATRLLSENQEARDMISGLSSQLGEMRRRMREQGLEAKFNQLQRGLGSGPASSSPGSNPGSQTVGQTGFRQTALQRQWPGGANQKGSSVTRAGAVEGAGRDEPLYVRTKPGAAPVRVPYSSAYPQYRRQAEGSVERSQVPRRLRSMVRNYFDAINPNVR